MDSIDLLNEVINCVPPSNGQRQDSSSDQLEDLMALGHCLALDQAVSELESFYSLSQSTGFSPLQRYEVTAPINGSNLEKARQLLALSTIGIRRGHYDGADLIQKCIKQVNSRR